MADYDEQLESLRRRAEEVAEQTREFQEGMWPDKGSRRRLEDVLAYVQLVLDNTDGALVAPALIQELDASLAAIIDTPGQVYAEFETWLSSLLDRLARLPVSRGRDVEQQVKRAARTFQRSAQQRFNALNRQTEAVRASVEELTAELAERKAEIDALVEEIRARQDQATEERLTQLDARSQEIQATVERHAQSIDALLTEQTEAFRTVQDERAVEHRTREEAYEAQFAELEKTSRERVDALVAEIDAMKVKSAELVGAIGITGTAERYGREFESQQKAADRWRWVTLGIGLLAAAVAVLAAFDKEATTAGAKVAIAILVGGVGFYTARQSSRHRHREEHARQLQLDLTAFPVFIEALPESARDAATVWMAERSFLGARTSSEDDDEPGLSLLSQVLPQRKKAEDE
jgi:hypothetical protein